MNEKKIFNFPKSKEPIKMFPKGLLFEFLNDYLSLI